MENIQLDDIDERIIEVLSSDSSLTNKELAKRVSIAPSTCHLRVRRLLDAGVLYPPKMAVNWQKYGLPMQALIFAQVQPHARGQMLAYLEKFVNLPRVSQVLLTGGDRDFILQVYARDAEELRDFISTHLSSDVNLGATQTQLLFDWRPGNRVMDRVK